MQNVVALAHRTYSLLIICIKGIHTLKALQLAGTICVVYLYMCVHRLVLGIYKGLDAVGQGCKLHCLFLATSSWHHITDLHGGACVFLIHDNENHLFGGCEEGSGFQLS